MCGIFGAVHRDGRIDQTCFANSLTSIAHRGPDGNGTTTHSINGSRGEVMLGHRRLSIFDLSDAGKQPMTDSRGRWITYNGEIFNWPELRAELEQYGYEFHTQTDTEVILAAYDKWGPDCTKRFNGFWAFGILDEGDSKRGAVLFLSRDHFGIKPLYYYQNGRGLFLFSSELKPIFTYLGEKPCIDEDQFARYIIYDRSHDSERTIYRNVNELLPACNALFDVSTGALRSARYWELPPGNSFQGNDEQAIDRFAELLEDSVRIRLRADREVGLTLSGGVDSSAIAAAASRATRSKLRAFTASFPNESSIDETRYASVVAKKLNLEHVLVYPEFLDLEAEERTLTSHQELMYVSFSVLVNWAVVREIHKCGIMVFLTGQGGDELFLGYERYFTPYLISMLHSQPISVPRAIVQICQNSRLDYSELLGMMLYFSWPTIRGLRYRSEAASVLRPEFMAASRGQAGSLPHSLYELQKQEVCGEQLRRLLRYDDRTAAAFGAEGRPAFLDYRLAEFAVSLAWRFKIRDGWTKYVVRKYLERAGLPEIAWRTHKLGFAAPNLKWSNTLLERIGDFSAIPGATSFLKSELCPANIPERMRFKVYNLLSTAREMRWSAL